MVNISDEQFYEMLKYTGLHTHLPPSFNKGAITIHRLIGLIIPLTMLISMVACDVPEEQKLRSEKPLVIMAASSLTDVLDDIGGRFKESHPEVTLAFNFDGSQRLRTQLLLGAKADIFISADWEQTEALENANLTLTKAKSFAYNKLNVIVHENLGATPTHSIRNLADLTNPEIKLVLANKNVPAGKYTRQMLEDAEHNGNLGAQFKIKVLNNLISNESNVRAVVQKVSLGVADVGVVYKTDVKDNVDHVKSIPVPEYINPKTAYPVVVLKDSKQYSLAQEFVSFLYSDLAQSILVKHRFDPENSVPVINQQIE